MSETILDPQIIVDFWREAGPEKWFNKDEAFDETIRRRFGDVYERAALGDLDGWATEPNGALALVILLDQFPRNMFRNTPKMYATDAKALQIAHMALARGDAEHADPEVNQFFVMPLMHSESLSDHNECVRWMERIGDADNVKFAGHHRDIVEQFGRFPHRNEILQRKSTPKELDFIADGGFGG
ncbi:DUF924 domain-containing protein [Aureimonas fodinaquatilis]|uniref:DUF924 domain-containing protein n=1 Tax=Aureimonas fodinaquatilis TaxID=2565783 RepID=A0A5B0E2A1_9HYPH|nr:DUF924 family protein [Aureimonas fodinaquatilis]KAA0971569.1 DUF924 domain-containing protein [Aureimonas fodinaquatilis]